eukprot:Platyproteum_vivax@DN120_c0_g1_i2.p3
MSEALADEYWNNLVLAVIGATLEPPMMVLGLQMIDKITHVKVEVWFADFDSPERELLRQNIETVLCTRLDGSLDPLIIHMEEKPHKNNGSQYAHSVYAYKQQMSL